MARPLRIEYQGAFYHVINRGLERREIYRSPKDYDYFLALLGNVHEKYGVIVHSYCLMPNHYHLYLQTPNANLSKAMRQLDGNFTQKFNKRHKRVGPLFQGRYKAVLVEADSYSLQLAKYIHLNPVKANMVKMPEDYQYSSYQAYIGKDKIQAFMQTDWLLNQFHLSKKKAIRALKAFTLQAADEDWKPETNTFKGLILGGSDFVSRIQETFLQGKSNHEIPKLKAVQRMFTPEEITAKINSLNFDNKLRNKLLIYALKKYSTLTLKEIGERISNLHYSAVSQIVIRLQSRLNDDKKLRQAVNKVDELCKMSKIQT